MSKIALAVMLSLALSGCASKDWVPPLTNDAYIWQRRWSEAVLSAIRQSAPSIRIWRVLAAEAETKVGLTVIAVDRRALREAGKPVIAVLRINGLSENVAAEIVAVASDWQEDGVPVSGIEIDYDCAVNRLAGYRDFLRQLRAILPRAMTLSITALPSWMGSSDLPQVLAEVDESVLQVHSVMSASQGLFDRTTAYKWAQAWSALSPGPFRLALPTYWSRVSWNDEGRVVSIESEADRYGTEGTGREILVEPKEVAALLVDLRRAPPRHLTGIAWFRLPTDADQRAWSLQTWRAVMLGQPLRASLPVVRFGEDQSGARNVYLRNEGELDTKLPAQVSISGHGCEFADAMAPYSVMRQTSPVEFGLRSNDMLRSGEERLIGWVRCTDGDLGAHVSF
jgi:hypothetical protein